MKLAYLSKMNAVTICILVWSTNIWRDFSLICPFEISIAEVCVFCLIGGRWVWVRGWLGLYGWVRACFWLIVWWGWCVGRVHLMNGAHARLLFRVVLVGCTPPDWLDLRMPQTRYHFWIWLLWWSWLSLYHLLINYSASS